MHQLSPTGAIQLVPNIPTNRKLQKKDGNRRNDSGVFPHFAQINTENKSTLRKCSTAIAATIAVCSHTLLKI